MDINDKIDLLDFFKTLADANRLKIIGLLAKQSFTVEKLAAELNLSASTTSHHLSRLSESGLVTAKAEGYYSVYSLQVETLEYLSKKFLSKENLPFLSKTVEVGDFERKTINEFTNTDGSIKQFPAQRKKMDALLAYIAKAFELEKKYQEKQVNEILKDFHPDFASLRRELVDIKFLSRRSGEYWLTELGYNSSRRYR